MSFCSSFGIMPHSILLCFHFFVFPFLFVIFLFHSCICLVPSYSSFMVCVFHLARFVPIPFFVHVQHNNIVCVQDSPVSLTHLVRNAKIFLSLYLINLTPFSLYNHFSSILLMFSLHFFFVLVRFLTFEPSSKCHTFI